MTKRKFIELCTEHPLMIQITAAWYRNEFIVDNNYSRLLSTHPKTLFTKYSKTGSIGDISVSGSFDNDSLIQVFTTIKADLLKNPEVVNYLLNSRLGIEQ